MVDELEEGQEVVTGGGMLGRVTAVRDNWVTIEVSASVSVKVQRGTISVVVPAGTIKNS
jgi:preprotein translocase subunit YajC